MSELAKMLREVRAAYARPPVRPREVVVSQAWYDRLMEQTEAQMPSPSYIPTPVASVFGVPIRVETPEEQAARMEHTYYGPVYTIHPDGHEADPRRHG